MLIDKLDLFILREIFEKEVTGTRIMAKEYFFKDKDLNYEKSWKDVDAKEMLILLRLKKLKSLNLVSVTREGDGRKKNVYTLIEKNIQLINHKFNGKLSKAIQIKINDKWIIFQL